MSPKSLLLAVSIAVLVLSTIGQFGLPAHASTIAPNSAKSVLRCQGLLPATPNCISSKLSEFETVVYDANNDHRFTSASTVIAGPTPTANASLTNDPRIVFRDTNNNGHWDPGESVFYNANDTVAGRVFLYGPPTIRTDLVKVDPRIRFVDLNGNGVLDGVVAVTARLEDLGGLLPDGTQQDVPTMQIVYAYEPSLLTPLCVSYPCGQVLSGQFDAWCIANPQTCNPRVGAFTYLVDNYCEGEAQGASPLDTIVTDNYNGKLYASSLCGYPFTNGQQSGMFDTGLGCDPSTRNPSLIGTCPGDITNGGVGALSALDVLRVEYMVIGRGSTDIDQIHKAYGVSGTDLIDTDGRYSTNLPVALFNTTFNNGATHSTTTAVSCLPVSVAVNTTTTCTATVTDPAASGIVTPTGTVTFAITTGTGSFNVPTCTLAAGTYAAGSITPSTSCSVVYKPSQIGTGSHTLSASFGGDSSHTTSSSTAVLTVTALNAGPDFTLTASPTSVTVSVGVAGTSTITVGPLNGFTGDVSLTSDNASCSLTPATVTGGSGTSTLSCTFSTTGSFVVTVTGTSGSLVHTATVDFTVTAAAGFDLSWQGYDWDGGHEEILYFNGQFLTSLPPVDTPSNGGAWASFSFDITSYIVNGTNTLTFTHANWDCSVSDTVGNLQVTSGATVVYSNSTSLPLTCTQWLTYTFMVGTAPPPPPPPELSISAGQSTAFPVVGETLTFSALSSGGVPPYMFTWNFGDGATGVGSTVNHEYAAPGTYTARATVTDSASRPDTSFVDIIVTVSAPSSSPGTYTLSWQGYDWDGGQEETLTINGQMVATLPPVDTPSNGGAWASFSFDITSYVVKGTNTLTFTHANWDCPISDSVRNLQLTSGTTVVYGNATVSPLACSQPLTYTFSV